MSARPRIVLGAWRSAAALSLRVHQSPDAIFVDLRRGLIVKGGVHHRPRPREMRIFLLIAVAPRDGWVARADIVDALYCDDPDGGAECAFNSLSIHVHMLRRWVGRFGLSCESWWGQGYMIRGAA